MMGRRKSWVIAMLGNWAILEVLFRLNSGFARFVADKLSRPAGQFLGSLANATPIPLAECAAVIGIAAGILSLLRGLWRLIRMDVVPLLHGLGTAALATSALLLSYAVLWSAPLHAPLLDIPHFNATQKEVFEYCAELIVDANRLCVAVAGLESAPLSAKASRYPELMRALSMGGVYVPWTGETIVSMVEPSIALPFIAAHESAHAAGYAREDEANFIAYQRCMDMGLRGQYSGTMFALYYTMETLHDTDESSWSALLTRMSFRVHRDYYQLNGLRTASAPPLMQWRDKAIAAFAGANAHSYGSVVNLLLSARYDNII